MQDLHYYSAHCFHYTLYCVLIIGLGIPSIRYESQYDDETDFTPLILIIGAAILAPMLVGFATLIVYFARMSVAKDIERKVLLGNIDARHARFIDEESGAFNGSNQINQISVDEN